jgi:hypothetical protein
MMGIPTVTITRESFAQVVATAFLGMKFPAEAPLVVYPVQMFLVGGDLTPLEQNIDGLIDGLTKWKPKKIKEKKVITPQKIHVEGKDYEEAAANVNKLFLRNLWSDGLPIIPPTPERVDWILTGTDLPRGQVVTKILPRGGIVTVETIAANLAMAGGRPEYLPVLMAVVEAISAPWVGQHKMSASTNSVYLAVAVNGPMAKQIRLGSGYGCLGPDPLHPAGASIGRAIRFLLQDAGGAVAGIGTMAIFGTPARFTNAVFAEDEAGLPPDWEPLHVEQGFTSGSNAVTTLFVNSATNMGGGYTGNKESALDSLNQIAAEIGIPNGSYWVSWRNDPEAAAGILLMARGTAQGLSKLGWSKDAVKKFLWEHSKVPTAEMNQIVRTYATQDPMPISASPRGIKIVVAGGLQSGHLMWLQVGCAAQKPPNAGIKLPDNWEELLKKAEEDLGPLPAN